MLLQGCKKSFTRLLLTLAFGAVPCLAALAQPVPPSQPAKLPAQPALLRFKFAPAKAEAFPGFTQVTDQTAFTDALGYGWAGQIAEAEDRQGPDALFRSWIASHVPFVLKLSDGAYVAQFVVGDNSSYPRSFSVTQPNAQGKQETLLEKKVEFADWWDWYFSLQDVEWDQVQSLWDTYVEHKFKTYTVSVPVTGGKMQLNFHGAPVCCLSVYPVALEASAKQTLDGVRAAQRKAFDKLYKLKPPVAVMAPELANPAAQEAGFALVAMKDLRPEEEEGAAPPKTTDVIEGRAAAEGAAGERYYSARNTAPVLDGFGAWGQSAEFTATLLPLRDVPSVKLSVGDLKAPNGAALPASAIEVACQRYAIWPNSPLGTGSSLTPRDIVTRDTVHLCARVPQRLWLTFKVPADAQPGVYSGVLTAASEQGKVALPIRFKVLPIHLDPAANVARGPFYYFPQVEGDRLWQLVENDFKFLSEHGMNSVPEFPNVYDILTRDGKPNPKWADDMDKFVALYRKYQFAGPIAPYSMIGLPGWCGLPTDEHPDVPVTDKAKQRLTDILVTMKSEEKQRGWPEIVVYVSDEVSNEGAAGAKWGVWYLKLLDEIKKQIPGGFRTCASMDGVPEFAMVPFLDFPTPNHGVPISEEWLAGIRAAGHHLWLYNFGWDRFSYGFYLWRVGATGRYQWHFDFRPYNTTSNPYNAFDYWIGTKYLMAYPTREGTRRATPASEETRAGVDDLRYLVTLEKAIAAAPSKRESQAVEAARTWLAWLHDHINVSPAHYSEYGDWHPSVYDTLRWQAAQHILRVQGLPVPE